MKAEFIARVMQIMNEIGWNDTKSDSFIGSDTTKVKEHIERVFVDAWRKATTLLPKTYFTIKDFSGSKIISDTSFGTGYIILPDDFYTLYSLKMKGWHKAISKLHPVNDDIYSIQTNEYVRGNFIRPIGLIDEAIVSSYSEDGRNLIHEIKQIIRYYSLPRGVNHKIENAYYIPLIKPLDEVGEITEKLFIPLAYICASIVFQIFEKPEIAKMLELQASLIS